MGGVHGAQHYVDEAQADGADLSKLHCVVTGASSGIGLETARALALGGAHVVMACRNVAKAEQCIRDMQGEGLFKRNLSVMAVDLESLASVQAFAHAYVASGKPLNVLVCNAGYITFSHALTQDGYERTFQVSFLANYLLFRLLQDTMLQSAPSRVILVTSHAYQIASPKWDWPERGSKGFGVESGVKGFPAYAAAKLAGVHLGQWIAEQFGERDVRAFIVHPGVVSSPIYPWWAMPLMRLLLLRPDQGAAPSVMAATSTRLLGDPAVVGFYDAGVMGCATMGPRTLHEVALNSVNMHRLMEESELIAAPFMQQQQQQVNQV